MFWNRTDKQGKPTNQNTKGLPAGSNNVGGNGGQRPDSAELRRQALANARAARERLGEDTIQKIAEALTKKQTSTIEQAKKKIKAADSDRIRDGIRDLMDE